MNLMDRHSINITYGHDESNLLSRRARTGLLNIKDSGPIEHVFDRIVRNDDSKLNEEKVVLLAERFTKFLRN